MSRLKTGGLAGAVRADQRVDGAARDAQVDAADRDEAGEFLREIVGFEDDVVSHDATAPVWTSLLVARSGLADRLSESWLAACSRFEQRLSPDTVIRIAGGGRADALERRLGLCKGHSDVGAGRRLCFDPLGQRCISPAHRHCVAQRRDRSHAHGCRHRSAAKPTSTLTSIGGASRRRLSLRRRATTAFALRRGAGAVAAHARLQRSARPPAINQFALTFASQTTTDTRIELGFWADTPLLFARAHNRAARARPLGARAA